MTRVESRIEGLTEDIKLPIKPFRIILKKYHSGEVSQKACLLFRDILIELADILAENSVKEFEKNNRARKVQGLNPLKRIDKSFLKRARDRFLYDQRISNMGEVGQTNTLLLFPKDNIKKKESKDIIENATEVT